MTVVTTEPTALIERRVRVRRFGVIATANLVAIIYLVLGIILGLPFFLIFSSIASATNTPGIAGLGIIGGLIGVIFYAVFGWIVTAIACLIYNLCAGFVGGIEISIRDVT